MRWKRTLLGLVAAMAGAPGLSACGDVTSRVADVAEDTRTATERGAAKAAAADQTRLAQIAEDAEPMKEAEAIALGERYYMRPEAQGWTVIDRTTSSTASINGQTLERMSLDEAEDAVADLRADVRPK